MTPFRRTYIQIYPLKTPIDSFLTTPFDTAMNVSYTLTSSVMTSATLQSYLLGSSFLWLLSDTVQRTYPAFIATVPLVTVLQGNEPPLPSYPSLPTPIVPSSNGTLSYVMALMLIIVGGAVIGGLIGGFRYCFCTAKDGTRAGQKEYELLGSAARGEDEVGLSESDDEHDRNNKHNGQYEQVSKSISL